MCTMQACPSPAAANLRRSYVVGMFVDMGRSRREGKPLWEMVVDMEPEQLIECIDFKHITDVITKEQVTSLILPLSSCPALLRLLSHAL